MSEMEQPEEPEPVLGVVTCHTQGCENVGIPIVVPLEEIVVCGPCSRRITDAVPLDEDPVDPAL